MTIHDLAMFGTVAVSVWAGWKHADGPFYDDRLCKVASSIKWRGLWLFLAGAGVVLWILLDPDASMARTTYATMSTTGFRIFWLFLMGGLVISYGVAQLVFHDMAASFHRFIREHRA